MIKGTSVSLRPVAEDDLEEFHSRLIDIEARGPWYPLPKTSLTKFRAAFQEAGFWSPDEGILVIVDKDDRLIGNVDWNKLNGDVPDVELGFESLIALTGAEASPPRQWTCSRAGSSIVNR